MVAITTIVTPVQIAVARLRRPAASALAAITGATSASAKPAMPTA